MEFLKALEEAKQLGVAKEDFLHIWENEMKLKMQSEETRALELKLACRNHPEFAKHLDGEDQVKNSLKELQQQINSLTEQFLETQFHINSLTEHNETQFQEISKLLEHQGDVITKMIRNELSGALNEFASKMNSQIHQAAMAIFGAHQPPVAESAGNSFQQQKLKPDRTPPSSWQLSAEKSFENHEEEFFPSEEGAILRVRNVESVVLSKKVKQSPMYYLSDCPCKVQLSIWFNENENINVEMCVFSTTKQHLQACRIFTVTGDIENRNSGSYSPLFDGTSQPLRKLKPDEGKIVSANVCLSTGSGSFDDVTFDDLDRRGFVINDSLIIKWYVTSEEA